MRASQQFRCAQFSSSEQGVFRRLKCAIIPFGRFFMTISHAAMTGRAVPVDLGHFFSVSNSHCSRSAKRNCTARPARCG